MGTGFPVRASTAFEVEGNFNFFRFKETVTSVAALPRLETTHITQGPIASRAWHDTNWRYVHDLRITPVREKPRLFATESSMAFQRADSSSRPWPEPRTNTSCKRVKDKASCVVTVARSRGIHWDTPLSSHKLAAERVQWKERFDIAPRGMLPNCSPSHELVAHPREGSSCRSSCDS